ncbi:condensin-2 complex subunit G2 isoform X1 [Nomia melanderi]|uniref:condensin-2 complex subunit G2 isoform X1 n=2 Tax=Nomia melanderi TaxID=2448451 RepID=UPI0013040FB4|nr:condensin-2 complex subunit G2-like isoform X3 [Nomia melanderi]
MLQHRALSRDKVLFRILKNKSPNGSIICEKLNNNVKNIVVLSEDELCELWQHMKTMLLEAQKLCTQTSKNQSKYAKEYSLMIKLIRTITAIALETIVQRIFIPNVLLQNVMLLHSNVLPNINDKQAKNEISYLLENWWKLDMTWREKVVKNVVKYLIQGCKTSLQHVKRLYEIRSAITLLKCTEDVQQLLKLVRENTVMSLEEGRLLILHLFTLGEQYILGIHNNIKVVLQNVKDSYITGYANLYVSAWQNATVKLRKFIVENCFQNIIFHCFRAYRDSIGQRKLGKNLLLFLAAIHEHKNKAARTMIHNQCKPLLWKHLKAPGSYIKCNAVEILFITSIAQYTCAAKDRNRFFLQTFYKTINDLLNDTDHEVRNVTMIGLLRLLEKHWNCVPHNIIRNWLNVLLHYTKCANNAEIRANVFIGLKQILIKDRSHRILKDFLPNFAKSIYDEDKTVVEALMKLLWHAQNQLDIPFWDIVPLTYVLDQIERTQDTSLLQELIKFLWLRICPNGSSNDKIAEEIIYIGMNNIKAIRRFFLHSKSVIDSSMFAQIIERLLSEIKKEMECIQISKTSRKRCTKKIKLNHKGNKETENLNNWEEDDLDSYRDIQICIDVIAMLLVANVSNLDDNNYSEKEIKIMQSIANVLPEFSSYFKETPVNDSIIFIFSLMPTKYFINKIEVMENLAQQLCSTNTSDDTLLSLIHVFIKWNKGQMIFLALTNLFGESLKINTPNNQGFCDSQDVFTVNVKGLELSLRILKHLLHVEYQSVLMNKYHQDVLKFWETLHMLRTVTEKMLSNECNISSLISKDLVVKFFKEYLSMVSLLHKRDVFDASEHFSEILLWIKKSIIPHIPHLDVDIEGREICIDLIKCTLDTSNLLIKEYNSTPKLCCDIVLLYCSCLSPVGGVVFLNNAFDAILKLLDFGKMAFDNNEPNLLDIIVPNFVCVTMVTLTRYNEDVLAKHTDNLKVMHELTKKYFCIIKSTFNDEKMCLPYITILFNTAISSISTEMTCVLQNTFVKEEDILITSFPYLAKKILKIILNTKKYQTLSVQVLTKTITSYTKIDTLSALVIMYKMSKLPDKALSNRLKNITLAFKVHNQDQSYDTPFDRSIQSAIIIAIDAILQK